MNTILVWLLISLPVSTYSPSNPGHVHSVIIERFVTVEECTRVAAVIRSNSSNPQHKNMCIQARIFHKE